MKENESNVKVFARQPVYLPGLVFFDQMRQVDLYVIRDEVQYERHHWGNRNKIKTPNGTTWLTVPVLQKGKVDQLYNETLIDNAQPWRKDHLNKIKQSYKQSPYFDKYFPFFEQLYKQEWQRLLDLDMAIIEYLKDGFGIEAKILFTSKLDIVKTEGKDKNRTEDLVRILKAVSGSIYLSGTAAKAYMEEEKMTQNNIELRWHSFDHPTYPQLYGEFSPHMSAIDLLFNCGEDSKKFFQK